MIGADRVGRTGAAALVAVWLVLYGAGPAGAQEVVGELDLEPLSGPLQPEVRESAPLWRVASEAGPLYPVVPADQLEVLVRPLTAGWRVPAEEMPVAIRLDEPAPQDRLDTLAVGSTVTLVNPSARTRSIQLSTGLSVSVEANGEAVLPPEATAGPGWLELTEAEGPFERRLMLVEPPYLVGQPRLRGPGRMVVDFRHTVEADNREDVPVVLGVWRQGRRLCRTGGGPAACSWRTRGRWEGSRLSLDPVVVDWRSLTLSEGP